MTPIATVLYRESEIRSRVRELGETITTDYAGRSPVFVSVLKGGAIFLADLFRHVDLPVRVDFMSISSYGSGTEGSGVVRILKDLDSDIGGEHVVVIEDIIDTGLTLSYLLSTLGARGPASIEICALLDKSVRRIPRLDIRYIGFDCPDRFVVGYGLDERERYRNLPFILAIEDQRALSDDLGALVPFLEGEPPADAAG